MSDAINDGGPAFPVSEANGFGALILTSAGMSLRDYLAAGAMQAFIGTASANCLGGLEGYEEHTAAAAYRMADAMLKARAA